MTQLSLGYSPCPNDTFIFYALMHGAIKDCPFDFAPPCIDDVEKLNQLALDKTLDVTKLSFHALGHVLDDYVLLRSGAALGRGCGPLLVARSAQLPNAAEPLRIAIPGRYTTAAMLLKLYLPVQAELIAMRFDRIMPAVVNGEVDAGVIIHESRFTYPEFELVLIDDLGSWWEKHSGLPIPLGGIAAKRSLGNDVLLKLEKAITASVHWAYAHQEHCLPYIRAHAQEMTDSVLQQHINLYVNDFSKTLGEEGEKAVCAFLTKGYESGLFPQWNKERVFVSE